MIIIIMYPLPFYVAGVLKTAVQIKFCKILLAKWIKNWKNT